MSLFFNKAILIVYVQLSATTSIELQSRLRGSQLFSLSREFKLKIIFFCLTSHSMNDKYLEIKLCTIFVRVKAFCFDEI